MDSLSAFAMGTANREKPLMVFDWDTAARIIRERGARDASAGLSGDWEWTGGLILKNGRPVTDGETYLASTWATPELIVDGENIPCFKMEDEVPDWNWGTQWPESARRILESQP